MSAYDAPPAYQDSQEEFDRKTNVAIQQSVGFNQTLPTQPEEYEEEYYDDNDYHDGLYASDGHNALSRNLSMASSSSSRSAIERAPVRPLRVHKKSASVGSRSSEKKDMMSTNAGHISHRRNDSGYHSIRHVLPDDDQQDRSVAPPPFDAVRPSFNGPPSEDTTGYRSHGSRSVPPSPLPPPPSNPSPGHYPSFEHMQSDRTLRAQPQRSRQSLPSVPTAQRQHIPQQRQSEYRPSLRPTTPAHSSAPTQYSAPRLEFDPSMAYSTSQSYDEYQNPTYIPPANAVNAAAFYNSAVSSQLSSPRPGISVRPQSLVQDKRERQSQSVSSNYTNSPTSGVFSHASPARQPPSTYPERWAN